MGLNLVKLDPSQNCLQRLSAGTNVTTSREKVKKKFFLHDMHSIFMYDFVISWVCQC